MNRNTPTSHFNCKDHPLRPPAWRWLRAVDLWDKGEQPSAQVDDVWVRKAHRLYRVLQQDQARQQRTMQMPALHQAYRLYTDEPSLLRWEVEARLLTDEPIDQIGVKCGSTPQVISAFEKVFFCVRDRLEASAYIIHQVIGNTAHVGLKEGDIGEILKLFGFGGGVVVLETLLDFYRHPPVLPERPEQLAPADLKELRNKLLIKATIVARVLPLNATLFKKLAILNEARAVVDSASGTVSPFLLSPPHQTLMSFIGEGLLRPTVVANPASVSIPAGPDLVRLDPPCSKDKPFGDITTEPGRPQKVAVA